MRDIKSTLDRVERRMDHLKKRISSGGRGKSLSYDKAELTALQNMYRIALVYNDARSSGGSHLENVLFMVRDVLSEVLEEGQVDDVSKERLSGALSKCQQGIDLVHGIKQSDEAA